LQFVYQTEITANQRISPGKLASSEASVFAAHFPANIIRRSHPVGSLLTASIWRWRRRSGTSW
jgi:hypothetical protein